MATKTLADMLFPVGIPNVESTLLTEVIGEYTGPWKNFVNAIKMVRDSNKRCG